MDSSTDILAFASQILAFLGFLATCIAVLRYLNPGPEYIALADLVGQVRQNWSEYESEGMPADEYTLPFLSTLERYASFRPLFTKSHHPINRLEGEVRDLLFVMNTKSVKCQLRAWANARQIKKLCDQAQLLRIGLPVSTLSTSRRSNSLNIRAYKLIVQVNRELRIAQKHPMLTIEDLIALEKMSRSRGELMRLIKGDGKSTFPPINI